MPRWFKIRRTSFPALRFSATLAILITGLNIPSAAFAADSPQFRGPDRSGIFPETGLLDSWPDDGPKMLWSVDGLGEGFASVSVADGRIFVTGMEDRRGRIFAFDLAGKKLWQREYGGEHSGNGYPGTRTTPTVDGDRIFLMSSEGLAVALEVKTGEKIWQADLLERFAGTNIYFGMAESPLIVDDKVIFTPGGKDASVVALDKATGRTVWTSKGLSDKSAYCSARLYDNGRHRQVITLVEKHLVGLDPETGNLLWKEPYSATYDIHAVSPVFTGDKIYVSHGYGQGGKLFELAEDGRSAGEVWTEKKLDVHHGGAVVVDGVIYGAASNKTWMALDVATGEILASIRRLGKGSVISADGLLYGYIESGDVLLVRPDPENFEVVSSFEIDEGSGHHWAHPVISDGVLYIRHGEVLIAFDIRAGDGSRAGDEAHKPEAAL